MVVHYPPSCDFHLAADTSQDGHVFVKWSIGCVWINLDVSKYEFYETDIDNMHWEERETERDRAGNNDSPI